MKLCREYLAALFLLVGLLGGCDGCSQNGKETAKERQLHEKILNHDHHHTTTEMKVPEAPEGDVFFKSIQFPKTPPYRPDGHFRYRKAPFPVPDFVKQYPDHFTVDEKGSWRIQYPKQMAQKLQDVASDLPIEVYREKIVRIVSEGLDTCTAAVFVLKMGGYYEEARTLFEKAIAEKPDDFYALYYWGGLTESEKPDEAETRLRRLVEMQPDSLIAVFALGRHIVDTHPEPREAIPYLEHAYTLNPEWHGPIYNLGVAYYRLQEYEKALRYLQASEVFTGPGDISSVLISVIQSTSTHEAIQGED